MTVDDRQATLLLAAETSVVEGIAKVQSRAARRRRLPIKDFTGQGAHRGLRELNEPELRLFVWSLLRKWCSIVAILFMPPTQFLSGENKGVSWVERMCGGVTLVRSPQEFCVQRV